MLKAVCSFFTIQCGLLPGSNLETIISLLYLPILKSQRLIPRLFLSFHFISCFLHKEKLVIVYNAHRTALALALDVTYFCYVTKILPCFKARSPIRSFVSVNMLQ